MSKIESEVMLGMVVEIMCLEAKKWPGVKIELVAKIGLD